MSQTRTKPLIFLVDDDSTVLRALRIILNTWYSVETSADAEQAIEAIRLAQPDVIVLDIRMPRHDGFWVFQELQKVCPNVPVIFNSAYQDLDETSEAQDHFAPFAFLEKNGNFRQFVQTVRSAAESAGWAPPPVDGDKNSASTLL